jgi:hypothetical protein
MPRSPSTYRMALLAVGILGGTLCGAPIVGFDSVGLGTLYRIDAQTGVYTPIGSGSGIAMSPGLAGGTILYSSGVNLYELNVSTGQRRAYVCTSGFCGPVGDHAYDSSTARMFALGTLFPIGVQFPNPITALLELHDSGQPAPGIPNSTQIGYSIVGLLGVDTITTIEYVPGLGLLGTDGYNALHRIDVATGQASLLAPLVLNLRVNGVLTRMNGLAYDPDTRRLLGSAPYGIGDGGMIGEALLYSIELGNTGVPIGYAGWLNDSPPSVTGIATVNPIPEPGSLVLAGMGLLAIGRAAQKAYRKPS